MGGTARSRLVAVGLGKIRRDTAGLARQGTDGRTKQGIGAAGLVGRAWCGMDRSRGTAGMATRATVGRSSIGERQATYF